MTEDLVTDFMTKNPRTISADLNLKELKGEFQNISFRHLPVMEGNKLVGIISKTDFEKILEGARLGNNSQEDIEKILKSTKVEKVMTRNPFSVPPDTPLKEVAEVFHQNVFHAIPVMENGKLVGIISHHDIFYYVM